MRRSYDWNEIRRIIDEAAPIGLKEASLGMYEDWSWTAETVWTVEDGYLKDLDRPECDGSRMIAGINGSSWDMPAIELDFGDGWSRRKTVYVGVR